MEAVAIVAIGLIVGWALTQAKDKAKSSSDNARLNAADLARAQQDFERTKIEQDKVNDELVRAANRESARSAEQRLPDLDHNADLRRRGVRYVTDAGGNTIPLEQPNGEGYDPYYTDESGGYGPPDPNASSDPYNLRDEEVPAAQPRAPSFSEDGEDPYRTGP